MHQAKQVFKDLKTYKEQRELWELWEVQENQQKLEHPHLRVYRVHPGLQR